MMASMIAHLLIFQPLMCPDGLPPQGARFSDAAAEWDRPIELWVDERTASAAECLAGALITSDCMLIASLIRRPSVSRVRSLHLMAC